MNAVQGVPASLVVLGERWLMKSSNSLSDNPTKSCDWHQKMEALELKHYYSVLRPIHNFLYFGLENSMHPDD
jgi:hypothetical protein